MRVVLAGRLSQLQKGQTGMESREGEMLRWARDHGHEVITITEDWQSGTTPLVKRKDLRPWVTEPDKMALYDALVAFEGARLSRGPKAMTNEIENWATTHGKRILTVRDGLSFPAEGTEGILWDVTHRVNHQRWLDDSTNYRQMQKHLRDNNFLTGKPPWFMEVAEVDGHKTLIPHPVNAEWTRKAIARYMAGDSYRAIGAWLDMNDVRTVTGGAWSPVSIGQLFRNPSLVGRRMDSSGKVILKHVPIVDRATWDELQSMLDTKASRKGVAPKQSAVLTSVAVCSKCGGPMYRVGSSYTLASGEKVKREYYRCHGTDRAPSKCGLMVSLPELENTVSVMIWGMFSKVPVTETVVIPAQGYGEEIAELERDLADLNQDADDYDEKHASLRARRKELKALPNRAARTETRETGRTWGQDWRRLADPDKRAWLLERGITVRVNKNLDTCMLLVDGKPLVRPMAG